MNVPPAAGREAVRPTPAALARLHLQLQSHRGTHLLTYLRTSFIQSNIDLLSPSRAGLESTLHRRWTELHVRSVRTFKTQRRRQASDRLNNLKSFMCIIYYSVASLPPSLARRDGGLRSRLRALGRNHPAAEKKRGWIVLSSTQVPVESRP